MSTSPRNFRTLTSLGLFGLTLSIVTSIAMPASAEEVELPDDYGGFVTAEGTKLKLNGGDFYFSGANTYAMLYSPDEAEEILRTARDLGLNAIRFWGFWDGEEPTYDNDGNPTLPANGTDRWGRPVLQSSPRVYNEQAFRNFDQAIYLAHVYGVKLVIPLMNEWDEFGGLKKYLEWDGFEWPEFPSNCGPHGTGYCYSEAENIIKAERFRFFYPADNPEGGCVVCKDIYFDYVHQVLNRVNTVTGVKYKDDPAIMAWEVMNEPRIGPWQQDETAEVIRDFVQDAADYIKSIDKNHLVTSGEEGFFFEGEAEAFMHEIYGPGSGDPGAGGAGGAGGAASNGLSEGNYAETIGEFDPDKPKKGYGWDTAPGEGSSFVKDLEVDNIGIGSFHAWPFNWNKAHEENGEQYAGRIDQFMVQWVETHAAAGQSIGKPVFLGEFGWQILRDDSRGTGVADRDKILAATYEAAIRTEISGMMYWNITSSHNPDEAVWKGEHIDRLDYDRASWDDVPIPHDQDFRFDIYCPEDATTCKIIRDATKKIVSKVENPDPPFTSICFTPRTVCGDECVILESSPGHCGECGNECSDGQSCQAGVCESRNDAEWGDNTSPYDTSPSCSLRSAPDVGGVSGTKPWYLGLFFAAAGLVIRRRRRGI